MARKRRERFHKDMRQVETGGAVDGENSTVAGHAVVVEHSSRTQKRPLEIQR